MCASETLRNIKNVFWRKKQVGGFQSLDVLDAVHYGEDGRKGNLYEFMLSYRYFCITNHGVMYSKKGYG